MATWPGGAGPVGWGEQSGFILSAMGSQVGAPEGCQVLVTLRIPGQRAMHQPRRGDLWSQKTTLTARGGQDSCTAQPTRPPSSPAEWPPAD